MFDEVNISFSFNTTDSLCYVPPTAVKKVFHVLQEGLLCVSLVLKKLPLAQIAIQCFISNDLV